MPSVVVLSSGGLKSAVAAAVSAAAEGVYLLVDHGSPSAVRGWAALERLCRGATGWRCVRWTVGPAPSREAGRAGAGGSESAGLRPEADLGAVSGSRGLIPAMLGLGAHLATKIGADRVITGVSQVADEGGLGAPFGSGRPDRRREFVHAWQCMIETALPRGTAVRVEAPLIDLRAAEIVRLGLRRKVAFQNTWSCEQGGESPCQKCESCRVRAGAFREAAAADPLAVRPAVARA